MSKLSESDKIFLGIYTWLVVLLIAGAIFGCSTVENKPAKSNAAESAADNPDAFSGYKAPAASGKQAKKEAKAAKKAAKKGKDQSMTLLSAVPRKCKNCTIVQAPTTNVAEEGGTVISSPVIDAENGSSDKVKDKSTEKVKDKSKIITKSGGGMPWWSWPLIILLLLIIAFLGLRSFKPGFLKFI